MVKHQMHYRAGTSGFSDLGIPDSDPRWYCECGTWTFPARPGRNGPNRAQAEKAHAAHVAPPATLADR